MENFLGKDGFIWWTGVIEDRQDPLNLGRCRVRIFGWHSEDKMLVPTESLPWALPKLPVNNSRTFTTPTEGEWVTGYFFDGSSAQFPVYDGVLPGIARSGSSPQVGFSDPRTPEQLMNSPAPPAKNIIAQDGSGTTTESKPAVRNPADIGFPSTNKLSINDLMNAAPQMLERAFNVVKDIKGPEAKTLGTEIAGAAQGAAAALQGIQPNLEALVPKASELAASIQPNLGSLAAKFGPEFKAALDEAAPKIQAGVTALPGQVSGLASSVTTGITKAQSEISTGLSVGLADVQSQINDGSLKAQFQKDLAEAKKNMAASEQSVAEQIAKAQNAASEALAKANQASSKDLTTLQAESKNIAGSISEKLKELSAANISTKTPVILSPATIGSTNASTTSAMPSTTPAIFGAGTIAGLTSFTTSIESNLYKDTPDEKLTYTGLDEIIWDRVNAERLRRKLPSLTDIGSPRPPTDQPPPEPKANLGAVAPAPLVATMAPNPIPNEVPLEKVSSTQDKALENSMTLYKELVAKDTADLIAEINACNTIKQFEAVIGKQDVTFSKWSKLSGQIESSSNDSTVFPTLNSYTKKYQKQLTTAFNARIQVVKESGGVQ